MWPQARKYALMVAAAVAGFLAGVTPLHEVSAPLIALLQLWLDI